MEEIAAKLIHATQDVIRMLGERTSRDDREVCAMRLEILAENAFCYDIIPLEAVDVINHAVHLLKSSLNMQRRYDPYQAQLESTVRRRGHQIVVCSSA
jgi:hypothetical protein